MKVDIDPRELLSRLSMWQWQVVEITKALSFNPKVIMLDEPTSALAQNEVQNLFEAVRALRDQGVIVIYITHKLQELPQIADTVTVLRDGKLVGTCADEGSGAQRYHQYDVWRSKNSKPPERYSSPG